MSNYPWRYQRRVIGIDPGQSGAIALLADDELVTVRDMPVLPGAKGSRIRVSAHLLVDLMWEVYRPGDTVVIEAVHSFPSDGHNVAFKFGEAYGTLKGVLTARRISYRTVEPTVWKRAAGLIGKPKWASLDKVRFMYPDHDELFKRKKDHGRADAVLIARFGV